MKLRLDDIAIYVAHYTKLRERRARLERDLDALGLGASWLTDHDPDDLNAPYAGHSYRRDDDAWRRKTSFYSRVPPRALRTSELSLALKHIDFYRRVKNGTAERALILEDDALLAMDFRQCFDELFASAPDDFDFVFIGSGCGLRIANARAGTHFYRKVAPATKCTDSYLITRHTAARLLSSVPPVTLPIDFELNYQIYAHRMNVYWLEPPMVVQGSQNGTYSSAIQ